MDDPRVLHESSGVIALWKPPGLPTQAPAGIDSVESWLRRRLTDGGRGVDTAAYVGVPHRLDRAVSGVILMATTPRAARKLSRQFERRQVRKAYAAIVACGAGSAGHVADLERAAGTGDWVEWRDLVEKVPDEPRARIVVAAAGAAREAVTAVRLLRRPPAPPAEGDRLFLELAPLTGRMHQLRLQAASRGLPVAGDELYGAAAARLDAGRALADDPRSRPIALHAWRIAFADPDTGREATVEAPLPAGWPPVAGEDVAAHRQ
ncbi:MAG: RluA family pseudouridine synthase [Planctomycetia bacterium]|nr:RluA family pseudouridine synthase [Planctomycetia bacterium]